MKGVASDACGNLDERGSDPYCNNYDIYDGNGGELNVTTPEGSRSEFIITSPS